ncbi:MAG: transglutaminase domain-containing protein [Lachnospiraceae bacterium]|nr:transglutaminase domain-containing protein [Lachnospiraceae bacterium]
MTRSYPYLYRFFQSLSFTVLALATVAMFMPVSTLMLSGFILYSAVIIIFWDVCKHSKYKKQILITVGAILIAAVLLGLRKREWLLEVYEAYRLEILLLLAIIPFTLFLSLIREKLAWLAVVCLLFIIYAAVKELPLHRIGGGAAFGFMLLSFIEIAGKCLYGSQMTKKLSGLFLLPLCLAVCLSVMPVSQEPYPFTALKNAWYQIKESAYVLYTEFSLFTRGQSNDFFVHFAGYDGSNTIGGSLLNSDKPALTVSVPGSLHGNLYLTGNIQNYYENNNWSFVTYEGSEEMSLQKELVMDYLELLYALYETDNFDDERAYVWHTTANVTYNGLYTKDMFFPLKLYEFKRIEEYTSLGNKFTALHPLKEGDSYQFRYMSLNYGSPALDSLIESRADKEYMSAVIENPGFSAKINRSYPPLRNEVPSAGFEALLAQREHQIYQNYMQIPDYLYDKIYTLTAEVTKDCTTDYEKLEAIEAYLQGFTYTKTPAAADGDAIEAFLFETQEGYCTYFASAFVLMSRSAGIPARYVNGFCVPVYSEQTSQFVVGSDKAHAWPEAYLTGIGWISFEPTAGYEEYHDTPWRYVPASQRTDTEIDDHKAEDKQDEEALKEAEENEEIDNERLQLSKELGETISRIIVILCISVPVILILFCVVRLRNRKKCYLQSSDMQKLAALMYYELSLLKQLGIPREANETLLQYAKRVQDDKSALEYAGLTGFVNAYMQSFYGMQKPADDSVVNAVRCVSETERFYTGMRKLFILYLRLKPFNEKI